MSSTLVTQFLIQKNPAQTAQEARHERGHPSERRVDP